LVKKCLEAVKARLEAGEDPEDDEEEEEDPETVRRRAEEEERRKKREAELSKQVSLFEKYIEDSGLTSAFQLIFAEIITKKIPPNNVFTYAAMRLR
jgi:hypothetical protein